MLRQAHSCGRADGGGRPVALRAMRRPAFSLIELIVVIAIIVIVLAVGVPGLSAMARDQRHNDAVVRVEAALVRAKYAAIEAAAGPVAVRFMPGAWFRDEENQQSVSPGRQVLVTYRWATSTYDTDPNAAPVYIERFERRPESLPVELPTDVWVAPVEATDRTNDNLARGILRGEVGRFRLNADPADNNDFLNADDFLIVFDARGQVVAGPRGRDVSLTDTTTRQRHLHRMYAFDPEQEQDAFRADMGSGSWLTKEPYQRYAFGGVTFYGREGLLALGRSASSNSDIDARREYLQQRGRSLFVHPSSANLVPARSGQ